MVRSAELLTRSAADMPNEAVQEFLDAAMEQFGGPVGLARNLFADYLGNDAGSPARVRIITALVSLLERFGTASDIDMNDLEALEETYAQLESQDEDDEFGDA